jgi:hypothetical protein
MILIDPIPLGPTIAPEGTAKVATATPGGRQGWLLQEDPHA